MAFRFLIVDDSEIIRSVIKKTIELTRLEVNEIYEASNGKEALDILHNEWVDLMFLDINMPIMNGMELVEELRKEDLLKELPVIVISTEGSEKRINRLRDQGVDAFLRKPFSHEKMQELVFELLSLN